MRKRSTPPRCGSTFTISDVTHLHVCHVLVGLPEFRVPFFLGRAVGEQASLHDRYHPGPDVGPIPELRSGERSCEVGLGRQKGGGVRGKDRVLEREGEGTPYKSARSVLERPF